MSYYNRNIMRLCQEYMDEKAVDHIDPRAIAAWAYREKKLKPQITDIFNILARDIGRALREEHFTDNQGRRVRMNHVVIEEKNGRCKYRSHG